MNKDLIVYSDSNNIYNEDLEQTNLKIVSRDENTVPDDYSNNVLNNTDNSYLEKEIDFFDIFFNMLIFFLMVQCFMRFYLFMKSRNARGQLQITLNNDYNFNRIILKDEFENDTCSICLDELYSDENGDDIIQIKCNHMFHKKCLDEWIEHQKNCPLCKLEL